MEKDIRFQRPYCVWIEDGLVYSADQRHFSSLFTRDELVEMRDCISNTLKQYKKNGITDEYIANKDKELVEIEFSKYRSNRKDKLTRNNYKGDLYLIYDENLNRLKIGRSVNVKSRFNQLQIATSNKLSLLYVLEGMGNREDYVHSVFSEFHVRGEWFEYNESIIDFFKKGGKK